MTDSPLLPCTPPVSSPLPDPEVISQTTALPDLRDLLSRPQQKHSPRKFTSHRIRTKRYQTKSVTCADRTEASPQASQSNSLFYHEPQPTFAPKTITLKDVKYIYDQRLKLPSPPPYSRRSTGSPHRHNRSRESPPRLLPLSDSSFPFIQPPRTLPLRKKHLPKASKSPKASNKHERSSASVDRKSPYDIHFIQPTIRKNFRLWVALKSSARPALVVRKATHHKELSSQNEDRKVFKMLNSLL